MSRTIIAVPYDGSRIILVGRWDSEIRVALCIAMAFIAWMLPSPFKPRGCS